MYNRPGVPGYGTPVQQQGVPVYSSHVQQTGVPVYGTPSVQAGSTENSKYTSTPLITNIQTSGNNLSTYKIKGL